MSGVTPFEQGVEEEEGEAAAEEVGAKEPVLAAAWACGCGCCWPAAAVAAAVVENAAFAEGAEATGAAAAAPVEETEAGEEVCGSVVAGSVSGDVMTGAEAVVAGAAAGAGPGVGADAAPVVGEGASGLGDLLNAGCDAGDCGKHVAGWPLWMPPSSYAWCFPLSGYLSSRPQKKWSSQHSGTGHEKSLCPLHCLNGLND